MSISENASALADSPVTPVQYQQPPVAPVQYQQPPMAPMQFQRPARQLRTNYKLYKYILLSIITLGIYGIVVMSHVSEDINTVASRYDGRKTMHYCLVCFIFSWLTLGIVPFVWMAKLSSRTGRELQRRKISYSFGLKTFWLWNILGSLILVGPYIFYHKLFRSMNLLNQQYNQVG